MAVWIALAPRIVAGFIVDDAEGISPLVNLMLTMLGFYYVPMAFLALAEIESERALNPLLVVRGILRMPFIYFALVTLAGIAFVSLGMLLVVIPLPLVLVCLGYHFLLIYVTTALMRAVALVFYRRGLTLES